MDVASTWLEKEDPQPSACKGFQTLQLQAVIEPFFPGEWLEAGTGSASVFPLLPCSWLRQWDELCPDGPGKAPTSPGSQGDHWASLLVFLKEKWVFSKQRCCLLY